MGAVQDGEVVRFTPSVLMTRAFVGFKAEGGEYCITIEEILPRTIETDLLEDR